MQKCWLWVALLGFAAASSAQTADELVAKNIAARGGPEKLRAIHTMTMAATISFGPQGSSPLTVHAMRPDKIREDFKIDGKPSMRAWRNNWMRGRARAGRGRIDWRRARQHS
jgi:hypothetical protein